MPNIDKLLDKHISEILGKHDAPITSREILEELKTVNELNDCTLPVLNTYLRQIAKEGYVSIKYRPEGNLYSANLDKIQDIEMTKETEREVDSQRKNQRPEADLDKISSSMIAVLKDYEKPLPLNQIRKLIEKESDCSVDLKSLANVAYRLRGKNSVDLNSNSEWFLIKQDSNENKQSSEIVPICIKDASAPKHIEKQNTQKVEKLKTVEQDKAERLFKYLRELSLSKFNIIREIEKYEKVLWLDDVPNEKECYCVINRDSSAALESSVWLQVEKPKVSSYPDVPSKAKPWIKNSQLENSSTELPSLKSRIESQTESAERESESIEFWERKDFPELDDIWDEYLLNEWLPWAEEDKRKEKVQQVYSDLFSIYQKTKSLGEQYEVVIGLGLLAWKTGSGQRVKHPLILGRAEISFDRDRGIISVIPPADGSRFRFYQDMLDPNDRPDIESISAAEEILREIGDDAWVSKDTHRLLKGWVTSISPDGIYSTNTECPNRLEKHPLVHFAPVIILRKRTEAGLLQIFDDIVEQISESGEIPAGVLSVISEGENRPRKETEFRITNNTVDEIYFPLPANEEQREIVRKIGKQLGVVVDGPPGTGKSHTICNLISHLLATGKRVLVTSHTSRALNVLKDKFESSIPEINPLCVALLDDSKAAFATLENSVQEITARYNGFDLPKSVDRIKSLEEVLNKIKRKEASIIGELRQLKEANSFQHPKLYGQYQGTLQEIGTQIKELESKYSWLQDEILKDDSLPLQNSQFDKILHYLRSEDLEDEKELSQFVIDLDELPKVSKFQEYLEKERSLEQRVAEFSEFQNHDAYSPLLDESIEFREEVSKKMIRLQTDCQNISEHIQPFAKQAAIEILAEKDRAWRQLLESTRELTAAIETSVPLASRISITGVDGRDLNTVLVNCSDLLEYLESGKKLGLVPLLRPKEIKESSYLAKEVRVDGRLANNISTLRDLKTWLEVKKAFNHLESLWENRAEIPTGKLNLQFQDYGDLCEPLEDALKLHSTLNEVRTMLEKVPGLKFPKWHDIEDLKRFTSTIEATLLADQVDEHKRIFGDLIERLKAIVNRPSAHPINQKIFESLRSKNIEEYKVNRKQVAKLGDRVSELDKKRYLLELFRKSLPNIYYSVLENRFDDSWDHKFADIENAWNWAKTFQWFNEISKPGKETELRQNLKNVQEEKERKIAELAAEKAWNHCFSRLTDSQVKHLHAWEKAMERLGKRTGKYTNKYRREAQLNMEQCRTSIPAWIMPIFRIYDSIKVKPNAFDVVIVDEASQSGPEALFLNYLAKQIIVVGDDKQISPTSFQNIEAVEKIKQKFIPDLPFSDALGIEHSFFDQGVIRFTERIRLIEHFRCMPEIIQFSNNISYSGKPLIPLRQYGSGRLEPVIKTVFVSDGFISGETKFANIPEAEAIVETIKECCDNPVYDGKTFGLISLLAKSVQDQKIESLLLERIGAEEIEKRRLICGNPYDFQGTERDVMFLSMVVAPDYNFGVLSKKSDRQRFNVAVSRAKDQLWVFHSITVNDLSKSCLRYDLLKYCSDPQVDGASKSDIDIDKLRVYCRSVRRRRDNVPSPFDSWFEVDVFFKIIEKGFRVIPQYEIGGYRIDFIVEGMQGRLAVECDGDEYHSAEHFDKDMYRQNQLERSGMSFWRIRGSDFSIDPDGSMQTLWSTLEKYKIYPNKVDLDSEIAVTKRA